MGEIRLNDISYTGGGGGSNVEANPSGQATSTLVKLGVDNTIYGIYTGTDVEANPTGTATETLTKLGVDGTVYGIDSGTDVEANPSGTPTDELSAIGIDGTVYEIIGFELPEHVTMDETKVRVSGDPTGWTSSENYYDEAISWSVGGRVYTKDNAQPALIAGCQYDGSAFYHTVAVSTIAAGTHYRWENYVNDQDIEFEYKGRTWYYSGGVGSYHELPYVGINDIGHFSTMLDAAKYLIDQADLAGAHFVQMSDPETGTIFAGGGEKEDLSDAPFKVTTNGAVYATEFYKNGVPIGGGGGSSYSETTLWSGTQASTGEGVSILLSDDISNYDAIIIDCGRQSGSDYRHGYVWYPVSDLSTGSWYLQIINTNDNCTAYWEYASNTSITWASAYSAYPVTLFSIKGVKFGGGGGSFEGLDYDRAIDLTLPDYTGYTYTPTEPGAIITKSYGSVGSTRILFNDEEYSLAYIGDTWTTPWLLVPATEITIKRGSSTGTYPSGSYIQFVPYKTGGGTGGGGNVDDVYVNGESVLDANKIAQIKSYKEVTQAEYDALPASKESDNILYCIKDKATADTTVAPIIYSEEEREVGVWTDGKPLYQKSVNIGKITQTGERTYTVGIQNVDTIVEYSILPLERSGDTGLYAIDNYNAAWGSGSYTAFTFKKDSTVGLQIIIYSGYYSSSNDIYVTTRYTKTTDQPGSGKYAPSGVPAVHYSENEQVVGTWIDGSTLYEKSYTIPQTSSGYTVFNFTGLNINEAINVYAHEGTAFAPSTSEAPYGSAPLSGYAQASAGELGFVGYITHDASTGVYQLHYRVGSYLSGGTARVTVRYNKITS